LDKSKEPAQEKGVSTAILHIPKLHDALRPLAVWPLLEFGSLELVAAVRLEPGHLQEVVTEHAEDIYDLLERSYETPHMEKIASSLLATLPLPEPWEEPIPLAGEEPEPWEEETVSEDPRDLSEVRIDTAKIAFVAALRAAGAEIEAQIQQAIEKALKKAEAKDPDICPVDLMAIGSRSAKKVIKPYAEALGAMVKAQVPSFLAPAYKKYFSPQGPEETQEAQMS
jgi:hypothetical protein